MSIKWYCPVCGHNLTDQVDSHRVDKNMTIYDTGFVFYTSICPSCGIEFGMGDIGNKKNYEQDKQYYIKLRKEWIQNGMKWKHDHVDDPFPENHPPKNWNPLEQLKKIPSEFLDVDEKY